MRHRVYGSKLGRNKDERGRLFKNLTASLFTYGTIETSEKKAKAIKGLVDKIINLAKEKNTHLLQSFLTDKDLRERLIKEIVPKLGNRGFGYTSLVKTKTRLGDQTMVVRMSLIGAEELKPIEQVKSVKLKVQSEKTEKTKKIIVSEKKVSTGRSVKSKKGLSKTK